MPSLIIFPDDHIGLISQQYKDDHWSNSLVQYYPETGEVIQNHIPSLIYELNDHDLISPRLFIDAYQRLWFDDRGWAEFSTGESVTWQAVIPSPVFIDVLKGHGLWYWGHPRFSAVSADGKLWYSSARGSGWLDSEKATWCIFTSYSSPVLIDEQQNLWLVAGGGLYKLVKN